MVREATVSGKSGAEPPASRSLWSKEVLDETDRLLKQGAEGAASASRTGIKTRSSSGSQR
jgi:hypothetical protein